MPSSEETIHINVTSSHALDDELDAAVRRLQQKAMLTGTRGILVTRDGPGQYTAQLSDSVPYGLTREFMR